ncbi:MAG: hypothetical protein IPO26_19955 [Saprospiraceae bacterium]|nr:hypothetical protein [Saprospiraceae bacterium]
MAQTSWKVIEIGQDRGRDKLGCIMRICHDGSKDEQIYSFFITIYKNHHEQVIQKTHHRHSRRVSDRPRRTRFMESKISAKLAKTVESKKRRKLTNIQSAIQELLIDLVDDDSEEILS